VYWVLLRFINFSLVKSREYGTHPGAGFYAKRVAAVVSFVFFRI
jgi:hypothetical protein